MEHSFSLQWADKYDPLAKPDFVNGFYSVQDSVGEQGFYKDMMHVLRVKSVLFFTMQG